jgi:hypothetical protein
VSRRVSGNVETQTDDGPVQYRGYFCEMMARAGTRIEDSPRPGYGPGIGALDVPGDHSGNGVKITEVEKIRAVAQLHQTVAAGSRSASRAAQKIDVAFSGEVEAMAVAADECARRSG